MPTAYSLLPEKGYFLFFNIFWKKNPMRESPGRRNLKFRSSNILGSLTDNKYQGAVMLLRNSNLG